LRREGCKAIRYSGHSVFADAIMYIAASVITIDAASGS
jgi:hypothetical protein